jgi:hypothetical protein
VVHKPVWLQLQRVHVPAAGPSRHPGLRSSAPGRQGRPDASHAGPAGTPGAGVHHTASPESHALQVLLVPGVLVGAPGLRLHHQDAARHQAPAATARARGGGGGKAPVWLRCLACTHPHQEAHRAGCRRRHSFSTASAPPPPAAEPCAAPFKSTCRPPAQRQLPATPAAHLNILRNSAFSAASPPLRCTHLVTLKQVMVS